MAALPLPLPQVDHCVYNNMGDSERCLAMAVGSVKLFHFTVCQKPWYCLPGARTCRQAQERWWQVRLRRHQLSLPVNLGDRGVRGAVGLGQVHCV